MYYKNIVDGYIMSVSRGVGETIITKEEYDALLALIRTAPIATDGYTYMLRADTLEWELVLLPSPPPEPEDDVSADEAMEILFGGDAE